MESPTDIRDDADDKTPGNLNSNISQVVQQKLDDKNMLRERKLSNDSRDSSDENEDEICHSHSKSKFTIFFKKYFLEGQKLDGDAQPLVDKNVPLWKRVVSSRRFWGILIPLTFFEVCS